MGNAGFAPILGCASNLVECDDVGLKVKSKKGIETLSDFADCFIDADDDADEPFDVAYDIDQAKVLGTGKFSTVRLCWKRSKPHKKYALKIINTQQAEAATMNMIEEEISILQTLGDHPGIASLVDVDDSLSNCIRIVMDLCDGGELYNRVQVKQYFSEPEARLCIRHLLETINHIHALGIMHRDLKPENILLVSKDSNTDVKISDFGLAKMSKYPRQPPRSTTCCGSDFYLAPELIKQEEYGREIDIWAMGIITYVVLSGCLPFYNTILHKLYRQIVERDLSFPDKPWKKISKGAQDFILRLLQVKPGERLTASQALNHPWASGKAGDPSIARQGSNSNLSVKNSQAAPHPLEHAHKV